MRNLFPHICITLFHLSIFVSVCTLCILPLLRRMINISVKCHFSSRPVYSPCLHQGFQMSCPCFCSCRSMCKHAQQWTCMCGHTHSIMQPKPILPPQLTQLGQQTAFHNSPNYPAAPCSVHLPRRATLIYNRAYVTSSGVSTLPLSKDTQKISLHGKEDIPPYVCLSCW